MLLEIKVKNFAIIDELRLEFQSGLNIISGETGAGKSVVLKALSLLMGEKSTSNIVSPGKSQASVEGLFDLEKRPDISSKLHSLDLASDENDLVVRRTISANGKGKVYINGCLCTLQTLRKIVSPLIDINSKSAPLLELTGQHDNQNLLNRHYHLEILDVFYHQVEKRHEYLNNFNALHELNLQIDELRRKLDHKEQRLDFLKYQQKEISNLNLKPGDEIELESQYKRSKNLRKIVGFLQSAEDILYASESSVLDNIQNILFSSKDLEGVAPDIFAKSETLSTGKSMIEEYVFEVRELIRQINETDIDIIEIEKQISQFRKLQKKYGHTVSEILETLKSIEDEIHSLENQDQILNQLGQDKEIFTKKCLTVAKSLHKLRKQGAAQLAVQVNKELKDLNMKGVLFSVQISELDQLNKSGCTEVEFMIAHGKTSRPNPLIKTASGGELSRILLSIKKVIGAELLPRTLLFDEVDTGVSGKTAEMVGRKLRQISLGQQLICVTHLPQVAAFGDSHFSIEKDVRVDKVRLTVKLLCDSERQNEIARLLSGEKITPTSLKHAKELIRSAQP